MSGKYWIKLYHEILDDPKMGTMSDTLYRRTIEIFLLAGEAHQDGSLPSIKDIAWRLRVNEEQLETEMIELQRMGILSSVDGIWVVTKFSERQNAQSPSQRMSDYRSKKQKQEYYQQHYEDVTKRNTKRNKNNDDDVTTRHRDIDIDIDVDVDTQDDNDDNQPFRQLFDAFLEATNIHETMINGPKSVEEITKRWIPGGVTPEDVRNAAKELLSKDYKIAGPWSLTNSINMLKAKGAKTVEKPIAWRVA